MDETALNQQIAARLGWRVENHTTVEDSGFPFEYTELHRPDGTLFTWDNGQAVGISGHDQALIWQHAPQFTADLNATSRVLAEHDVTLRLDYGPAYAATVIPEGRVNDPPLPEFVTHSADHLRAEMSELAARSLLAYLEWMHVVSTEPSP